jgi:hypothetical protein
VAVVDAALLVETGGHLRFDRLVVVYCDPQEQLCRLMARDGLSEKAARARLDAQMRPDEKRGFGHFVVDASDSLPETDARADAVARALRADAAPAPGPARIDAAAATAVLERGPHEGPRGLAPWLVVESIASTGTLHLARLAALLDPPHDGPWYTAPETAVPSRPPEALAAAVALWTAARRPSDERFAVAAAASLARLTHRDADAVAGAIVAALAARHAVLTADAAGLRGRLPAWVAAARQWTGADPSASAVDTVLAAAAHPADREAAAGAAQIAGGLPELARALAGGPPPAPPPGRRAVLERVLAGAAA